MPSNNEERNDLLWSTLKDKMKNARKATTELMQKPSTWLQSIQQEFIKQYFSSPDIEEQIIKVTSTATNHEDILEFLDENPQLSIVTIASGFKGEITILHHFKGFALEEGDEKTYFTLNGNETTSNLLQVIPQRLLKSEAASVPDLKHFTENKENDIMSTSFEENAENATIANSIILPPNIAKALIKAKANTAEIALQVVLDLTKETDEREEKKWSKEKETETADDESTTSAESREGSTNNEWNHKTYKTNLLLLQHLHKWSKLTNKREAGFRLNTHKIPDVWQAKMNNDLQNQNNNNTEDEQELEQTKLNPNKTYVAPDHIRYAEENHMVTPPRNQNNKETRFTFENEEQTQSLNGEHTQRKEGTTNLSSPTMEVVMNKMAGALDKFANAQSAQSKEKQKIPNNILQMLRNAGTKDGQEPAEDITENLRDIMRSGQENTQLSLDLMLHKQKATASPTARFVRGIHKGLWAFEPGTPDNVTIMNLPANLSGTSLENIDMPKLKEEEARGRTLTDKERNALYGKVTIPSKTIQYLQEKVKAWEAITTQSFEPDSIIAEEATNWREWLDENVTILKNKTYTADRDLPVRIECIISDLNNQFLTAAKFEVPRDTILAADDIRQGIIRGMIKPDIPRAILEIIRPEKKRKENDREGGSYNTNPKDSKQRFQIVKFDNQPREFRFTTEKYRNMIYPQVAEKRVKAPRCEEGNCSECLRFLLLGGCNTNCPRASAHICPTSDSRRMNNIRKFIKECQTSYNNNKKSNDPNFD